MVSENKVARIHIKAVLCISCIYIFMSGFRCILACLAFCGKLKYFFDVVKASAKVLHSIS